MFWAAVLGITLNILAIIFGIIAMVRAKNEPKQYTGKGIAIIGVILGILGLLLMVIAILFFISLYEIIWKGSNTTALSVFDLIPRGG